MSETADFATVRRDNPDGSRKIVTAPMTIDSAAPTSGSFDNVAVWLNERGAGGEVIR